MGNSLVSWALEESFLQASVHFYLLSLEVIVYRFLELQEYKYKMQQW